MAKYADFINQQKGAELEQSNRGNQIVYDKSPTQGMPSTALNFQPPISREYSQGGDLQSITMPQTMQNSVQNIDIDSLAEQQFNIGRMAIENEFVKQTNLNKQTTTDILQIDTLNKTAQMIHDMKIQELMGKRQKYTVLSTQANKDPKNTQEDLFVYRQKLLENDPIYKIPETPLQQKPVFTANQQQRGIGEITKLQETEDKEMAITKAQELFGMDFDQTAPMVKTYIDNNFKEPIPQEQKPKGENIWKRISNWSDKTPTGYIANKVYEKYNKMTQNKPISKPTSYPDAVWSEEHKMWTVIENGRLMGIPNDANAK